MRQTDTREGCPNSSGTVTRHASEQDGTNGRDDNALNTYYLPLILKGAPGVCRAATGGASQKPFLGAVQRAALSGAKRTG